MAQTMHLETLITEHRALRAAGVESFTVRQRMIRLAHLRKTDFAAWVRERGALEVFDVIEADGAEMQERLTDKGTFRRDEITLARPQQSERRAV